MHKQTQLSGSQGDIQHLADSWLYVRSDHILEVRFCKSPAIHQGNDQSTVRASVVRPRHVLLPTGCRAGRSTEGAAEERGKRGCSRDVAHSDVRYDDWVCRGGETDWRREAPTGSGGQVEGDEPWAAERHPQGERRTAFWETGTWVTLKHSASLQWGVHSPTTSCFAQSSSFGHFYLQNYIIIFLY